MVSVTRAGANVAQLVGNFRHAVTIGSSAVRTVTPGSSLRPSLASSSRAFQTYTACANASSSSSSSAGISDMSAASETTEEVKEKPKRKRRSKEELEAARMAKAAFGIPIRSQRRTRTALGGTAAAESSKGARGREGGTNSTWTSKSQTSQREATGSSRTQSQTISGKRSCLSTSEVLDTDIMEQLLQEMKYDHLPSRDEWKEAFPNSKQHQTSYRYFVSNRNTIQEIIPHLGINARERNGEKVTIIEGYPGPGTFASEFIKIPEVEKVIALEAAPCYYKKLELLKSQAEEQQPGAGEKLDMVKSSRLHVGNLQPARLVRQACPSQRSHS